MPHWIYLHIGSERRLHPHRPLSVGESCKVARALSLAYPGHRVTVHAYFGALLTTYRDGLQVTADASDLVGLPTIESIGEKR